MWSLRRPSNEVVAAFLERQRPLSLTYAAVGATCGRDWPAGFNHDRNSAVLGRGAEVFERAAAALRAWQMFPAGWTEIIPAAAPQRVGGCVAILFRIGGVWWLSAARIVYEVDDAGEGVQRRIGFAYGTLPGHVECGEERFTVTRHDDDTVSYDLQAFSRPRHLLARLGKPVARAYQRRFVRQSLAAMQQRAAGS